MKTIGIIAEYNPFHNGHAYHIRTAKEAFCADRVIIAMSGNFVQRGAPAITDKFSRTAAALQNGADFVFEIPTVFATASAESFAAAGIALFDALGCVDAVSFGCETPNLTLLSQIADILANEPADYKKSLSAHLKKGEPFPAARERALLACQNARSLSACPPDELAALLSSPNNILALEYLKAIARSRSRIKPVPILRKGAGYHDTGLREQYCSAAAIRAYLTGSAAGQDKNASHRIASHLPESAQAALLAPDNGFLTLQSFSDMLYYRLLSYREQGFTQFADCSLELSNRIVNSLADYRDYRGFCELLKKKEVTYSRISRVLLHILLDITNETAARGKSFGYSPYLRLLGFRRDAAGLFGRLHAHAKRPLITKPAAAAALLEKAARPVFDRDVFASDLYYGALAQKTGRAQKQEYRRGLVIL